ncbi:MAG: serine/threonine protein kinase [Oscillospiraceae bacterium]|nr:serine/threonine protein kinase [Oscillospiraceae bacterium]
MDQSITDRGPLTQDLLPPGFRLRNEKRGSCWQIVRCIGSGGFGVTYEALELPRQRRVAVKELFPRAIVTRAANGITVDVQGSREVYQKMLNSFYKEASVLSTLRDIPSVVTIYDYFYSNNTAYYVMEYIDGVTLLKYIESHGKLAPSRVRTQFIQLMEDVDRLHRCGIIHRDISPDNIMITGGNRFMLIDFGSARSFENEGPLTVNLKRNFAPLEQYTPTGQGPYTDVYSLAATMYYCFSGGLTPDAFSRRTSDRLVSPIAMGIPISQRQENALLKALSVRREDRYQSMREFKEAFYGGETPSIPRFETIPEVRSAPDPAREKQDTSAGQRIRQSLERLRDRPLSVLAACVFVLGAVLVELLA